MVQKPDPESQPVPSLLKVVEAKVNTSEPWTDDVLDRKEIAERLTSIVRGQEAPFVISLDGHWGTGKTFLLRRWAQDLRNQDPKWQAIYYNAWEDDFAGDPLLSITGQLSEHLGKEKFSEKVRGALGQLVRPAYFAGSVASMATTGMPLPGLPGGSQTDLDDLGGYHQMRAARDELKQSLTELAAEVRSETGQPLIFIIDELDRCRPTFAIELLERVKRIFDVPNIAFVFGINRRELVKSLESVYGDIDAGTYLRRFFDMEFVLPDADPTRFCTHLFNKFRLPEFFHALSKRGGGNQRFRELRMIEEYLPVLLGNMGLSLRDMDYCLRLLSLAGRDPVGRYPLHPVLLALLVAVKITEPALYRRFVEGSARGGEVIDYLNGRTPAGVGGIERTLLDRGDLLERVHAAVYAADNAGVVRALLERMANDIRPDQPEYLSREHARLTIEDSERLLRIAGLVQQYGSDSNQYGVGLGYLAARIDLYSGFARR